MSSLVHSRECATTRALTFSVHLRSRNWKFKRMEPANFWLDDNIRRLSRKTKSLRVREKNGRRRASIVFVIGTLANTCTWYVLQVSSTRQSSIAVSTAVVLTRCDLSFFLCGVNRGVIPILLVSLRVIHRLLVVSLRHSQDTISPIAFAATLSRTVSSHMHGAL